MDKKPITPPSSAPKNTGSCCAWSWMEKLPLRCCHVFALLAGFLMITLGLAAWSTYKSHHLHQALSQLQSQLLKLEEQVSQQTKGPSLEAFEKTNEHLDRLLLTLQEQAEKLHQLEDDLLQIREQKQDNPKTEPPHEETPDQEPLALDTMAHAVNAHEPESPPTETPLPEPTPPYPASPNPPLNFDQLRAAFKKALPQALSHRPVEDTPPWHRLTQGIITIRKTGQRAEFGSADEILANIEKHLEAQQAQEALTHLRRLPQAMKPPFEDLIRTLTTSLPLPQVQP